MAASKNGSESTPPKAESPTKKVAKKTATAKPAKPEAPPPLNIHQRILAVMASVEYLKKDGVVTVRTKKGAEFSYAAITHDAVTAAIRPAVIDAGIIPIVNTLSHHFNEEKMMTMLKIQLDLVNVDDPSQVVTHTTYAYGQDFGDKGPGKALSLGTKNLYLKGLLLETGEDDESRIKVAGSGNIDEEQIDEIYDLIKAAGSTEAKFISHMNTKHELELLVVADIPKRLFPYAEGRLRARIAQLEKKKGESDEA